MRTSRIALWGLTLALMPMLAMAESQLGEDSPATMSSPSMQTPDQNTGDMSRQGGASGMEDQSGSMQMDRQQQLKESHEPSSATDSMQSQQEGAGSMNEENTNKTGQGTADISDQRTQDETAP